MFNEHHAGRGLARAIAIMNGVDAIAQNELGLAIEVVHIVDYTNPLNDPFRELSSNIDSMLMPALQEERLKNPNLTDDLSLVHLFTGHQDQNAETLVGLGWLNSVCNNNGFDVSLSSPFLFDTLLATHEIMHNLGAPHDNSDACETYTPLSDEFLMWSNISGNTNASLSACSIDYARAAHGADCAVDAIDVGIELSLTSAINTATHELTLQVINTDTTRSASDVISHTNLPTNTQIQAIPSHCYLEANTLICTHAPISPSQVTQTQLLINTAGVSSSRLRSEVLLSTNVDRNLANNVAILDLPNVDNPSNNLVTISTNTSAIESATLSSPNGLPNASSNALNDSNQNTTLDIVALDSLAEPRETTSAFSRIGAVSVSTLWLFGLLVLSRLVASINRIQRNRL